MSKLYFECRFKSYKLRSLDLPIEVREFDLTLVTRCRSSQSVELEPGIYYLTASLPTGKMLKSKIQLAEGIDILAILTSREEEEDVNAIQQTLHFLGGLADKVLQIAQPELLDERNSSVAFRRSGGVATLLRTLWDSLISVIKRTGRAKRVTAKLRLHRGNVLEGNCSIVSTGDWLSPLEDGQSGLQLSARNRGARWLSKSSTYAADEGLGVARFFISGVNSLQLIQLLQPHIPAINVMLPVSKLYKCSLVLKQLPNGSCAIDIHLANAEADLLLRYLQEGLFTQGAVLADSEQQTLEALLNLKWDDPIAAAVSAYTLLRFNDLVRMKGWTEDLSNRFAWLPDGIAIRGEYLARNGEHDQALTLFLDLPSRGLPVFSDGLSYIIDRLKRYTRYGEAHFDSEKLSQARTLLDRLQRVALFVDFRQSLLTFNGIDPANPENNPLEDNITSYKGSDVASLLYPPGSKRRSLLATIKNIRLKKVIESLSSYFKKYRASLLGIGVIIPVIAALVTLICYFSYNFLLPPSFLIVFEGGWYVLLCGVFFTGVIWGMLPTLYSSFVTPEKANTRSYRALKGRLLELESRLGINEMSKKSLTLEERRRAVRVSPDEKLSTLSALDEAYTCYRRVSEELEAPGRDLRWMLRTGYIKAWKTLHRAEEALVQIEPVAQVIRGAIRTNVRIQNSNIGTRIQMLRLSRQAVKNADNTSERSESAKGEEPLLSNTSFSKQQVGARITSRITKQVFNKYRDNLWQGLVGKRNLLLGQLLVTGIATYVLLCIATFISNPAVITEATVCYIAGFIAGLIGPLYRALKRNTAIDDYGFTWTYVPVSCLFSGLIAVVGLLVMGRLSIPNISPEDLFAIWLRVFRPDQLVNLLLAVFFGLLSNLYFIGLIQEVGKIEIELLRSNAPSPDNLALPIGSVENNTDHLLKTTSVPAPELKSVTNELTNPDEEGDKSTEFV